MVIRQIYRLAILTLIIGVGLSGVVAGGVAAWLHSKGGLDAVLTRYLQERFPSVTIGIAEIDWQIDAHRRALVLSGNQVRLMTGEQTLNVPSIDLVFTLSSLVRQMPTAIVIDTDRLEVTHSDIGWQFSDALHWQADTASDTGLTGQNFLNRIGTIWPDGLQELRVRADALAIRSDTKNWQDLDYYDLLFVAAPEGGVFANGNVFLTAHLSQIARPADADAQLQFSAQANLFSKWMDFTLKLEDFETAALASHLTAYADKFPMRPGRISAQLSGALDETGLQILSGSMRAENGRIEPGFFSEAGDDFTAFATKLDYSAADNILKITDARLALADGKNFELSAGITGVKDDKFMLSGQVIADDIAMGDILKKWPETQAPALRKWLAENSSGGRLRTIALQLAGGLNWPEKKLDIASLGVSGEVSNLRLSYSDRQYQTIVGTVGGQFEMEIGTGGHIQKATGAISLRDGFSRLSGFAPTVKIPRLDAVIRHQPEETILQNLFIDFGQHGQILANGRRMTGQESPAAEISLSLPKLDVDFARHIWPDFFAGKVIGWMDRHLENGIISDGQLEIGLVQRSEKWVATQLQGSLPFTRLSYRLHEGLMPLEKIAGQIDFADNQLQGRFEAGQANSLAIEQAQVSYGPLLDYRGDRQVMFKTLAYGDIADILTILDHPKINQIDKLGLRPLTLSGKSRFSLSLAGVTPQDKPMKIADIRVDGTVSDADIDGLPLDQHLQEGALVISVADGETRISGSGRLSGIESDFNYRRQPDKNFELQLKLANSEYIPAWVSEKIGWPLSGAAAARLNVTGRAGSRDIKVNVRSDVTDLGVQHDSFEWAKLQGESGFMNAQLVFKEGKLATIEAIDIETGSLRAKGRIAMDAQGRPSFGVLEDLVFPGTELASVLFEINAGKSLSFTAEGKTLNLQPLRRDNKIKQGLEIAFDVTADRIVIGPKLSFSGVLKGQTRPDGNGKASLQGALYVKSKPLISEASLETRFGPAGEYLQGVGLIGGAEAELSYMPDDAEAAELIILTENAGRVLSGLGITEAVRRGRMLMRTRFSDATFERYSTTFDVDDFVVVEAPTAVRMFSVLSLAGLYGLVEGEGTAFARGQAIIHSQGDFHNLERVQAGGAALGISLVGQVDRQNRTLDVSGNLVPVNLISNIISKVPIVAEILTGVDKTGLFATQFSMQGSIDEPEVGVNALALAPGLLRDLFSPDWLGAESKRIFGLGDAPQ